MDTNKEIDGIPALAHLEFAGYNHKQIEEIDRALTQLERQESRIESCQIKFGTRNLYSDRETTEIAIRQTEGLDLGRLKSRLIDAIKEYRGELLQEMNDYVRAYAQRLETK